MCREVSRIAGEPVVTVRKIKQIRTVKGVNKNIGAKAKVVADDAEEEDDG